MTAFQFSGHNSNRANTAFMVGLFTILGAWGFELIGGFQPCELCLEQRLPYYVGLPILAVTIGLWKVIPPVLRLVATLVVALVFVWSIYLAVFHAGVEWGFWPGPTACTGTGDGVSFDALGDINANRVVMCDVVQFRFLGLSFAGWNAVMSAIVTGLLLWSAWGQVGRMRAPAARP